MLRCTAGARLRPWRAVRGHAALRGGARGAVRLSARPLRRVGGRHPGLHLLLHAGVPAAEPREEEDVLGAAGAALPGAIRAGHGTGPSRAPARRYLRLLQRLRRHRALVGPVARQPLHAQSRPRALQVRTAMLSSFYYLFIHLITYYSSLLAVVSS